MLISRKRKILYCLFLCMTMFLLFNNYNLTSTSKHFSDVFRLNPRKAPSVKCYQKELNSTFRNVSLSYLNVDEVLFTSNAFCYLESVCNALKPLGYIGVKNVSYDSVNSSRDELHYIHNGGWSSPLNCKQNKTVAIIIPYRDRLEHLKVLLRHLHPILHRQQLHYRIFVVQQDKSYTFNRGKLVNVGVREALKLFPFRCIIIHDVDLIPEDDRIDYSCSRSPLQLAVLMSKYNYKNVIENYFGGVSSLKTSDYIRVNGFSNNFWHWGGEDDSLYQRLKLNGLEKEDENTTIARYTMLKHVNRMHTRTASQAREVNGMLPHSITHWKTDGYNSVKYRVNEISAKPLYTLVDVNLMKNLDRPVSVARSHSDRAKVSSVIVKRIVKRIT